MHSLDRPIVVVGAARSGTTLLAQIMARHPDIAYWVEPRYVWRYKRPLARDDVRSAEEATPAIRKYIRRAFAQYAARNGKARFMEKTPSNCFRVPFVDAVLPDARYLHLIRDGRDVARSAVRRWKTPYDPAAIRRRLTSFEVPLRDLPFHATRTIFEFLRRRFLPDAMVVWGPHFPGIDETLDELGVEAACALQWRESVRAAMDGLNAIPPERQISIRFEDLVSDPASVLSTVFEALELSYSQEVVDFALSIVERQAASKSRDDGLDDLFDPYLQPLLAELGYL